MSIVVYSFLWKQSILGITDTSLPDFNTIFEQFQHKFIVGKPMSLFVNLFPWKLSILG